MAMGEEKQPGAGLTAGLLAELDACVAKIASADERSAGPMWGAVHKHLMRAHVSPGEIMPLVMRRDLAGLRAMVDRLAGREAGPEPAPKAPAAEPGAAPAPPVDSETLKSAMRAFRKRLKLTRLDHESRLGVGPMSSGRKADFDAIMPPQEFPEAVWEALVAQGKLKAAGRGFYMLAEGE
jgi:hypothetical protein